LLETVWETQAKLSPFRPQNTVLIATTIRKYSHTKFSKKNKKQKKEKKKVLLEGLQSLELIKAFFKHYLT